MRVVKRWLWKVAGFTSLGVGLAGIILPLVPTTPLLLLAAWCFARSSQRWHDWLLNHRHFGPPIRDWQRHRALRRNVKFKAIALAGATFAISIAIVSSLSLKLMLLVIASILILWLLRVPVLE